MENKKEYLNEENYQKTKNKITKISLIILTLGLVIGIGLIITGVIIQNNTKKINEERRNEANKLIQERLTEIATEKNNLNNQIQTKEYSCNSLDMRNPNWYADKIKCQDEVSSLIQELNELEMEEFQLENRKDIDIYNAISPAKYIIFYILGGLTIIMSVSIAGSIYLIAKRREIVAFTIQQTMPLAQEGMEKMTPTVGNAVGTIGKELAKGIKEGINEADKTNKREKN